MAKTLISVETVSSMVRRGMSQAQIARELKVSREAVRLRCNEIFGTGVITQKRQATDAYGFFSRIVNQLMAQEKAMFLLWVVKEAMMKGYQVALPLVNHHIPQTLLVNGQRVWVSVAKKPYRYGKDPLYHWEVNKTKADVFICLGMKEDHVKYCLVVPSKAIPERSSAKTDRVKIYLPSSKQGANEHASYPFAEYLNGWKEVFQT